MIKKLSKCLIKAKKEKYTKPNAQAFYIIYITRYYCFKTLMKKKLILTLVTLSDIVGK